MKMHADQIDLHPDTVAALVREQFPDLADAPIRQVDSTGTVCALFRLGEDVVLRFPLLPSADADMRAELTTTAERLARVAELLPVATPGFVGLGRPGPGYPGWWSANTWLAGETAYGDLAAADDLARDLAEIVAALWTIDVDGETWRPHARGGRLTHFDDEVHRSLTDSADLVDTDALRRLWQRLSRVPEATAPRWVHADLMPGNLILRDDRLAAVIDWELLRVADPAVDLMPAWNLFDGPARTTFRRALAADDALWDRGRAWALVQAIGVLPYYVDTNPTMADTARRTLAALLSEAD